MYYKSLFILQGFAILRFIAKNPGMWLFHCHIDFHSELGMTLVFKVGDTSQFPLPPPNFPKCGQMEDQDQYSTTKIEDPPVNEAPPSKHSKLKS